MERFFRQAEFQPQDFRDLGELVDRGVRLAVFEVRQTTECDPGELGEVALTEAELPPPGAEFLPDFLIRHGNLLRTERIEVRFSPLSSTGLSPGSRKTHSHALS